jgi:hypothetical protein
MGENGTERENLERAPVLDGLLEAETLSGQTLSKPRFARRRL